MEMKLEQMERVLVVECEKEGVEKVYNRYQWD